VRILRCRIRGKMTFRTASRALQIAGRIGETGRSMSLMIVSKTANIVDVMVCF
jgi:hypothetical protein